MKNATGNGSTAPSATGTTLGSPADVVREFLERLAARDAEGAATLLADDVAYVNVSVPAMHGRERVHRALASALRLPGTGFEVYFHTVAEEDGTVLTERTDVLLWGRLRVQFWVCGRFDVEDGHITLWKDYFDWWDVTLGLVRGLAGMLVPAVRAKPPGPARSGG